MAEPTYTVRYYSPEQAARALLEEFLTEEQTKQLGLYGYFDIKLPWYKVFPYWRTHFRIFPQNGHNFWALTKRGGVRSEFCLIKRRDHNIPNHDIALSVMMHLRHKTRRYLLVGRNVMLLPWIVCAASVPALALILLHSLHRI